jgi:F-type H+-transporting ATPase subunit b
MIRSLRPILCHAFTVLMASAFFCVVCAQAAEQNEAANANATSLFQWINFAIVAGLLLWVFGKLLPPLFRKNADGIRSAITQATEAKNEADRLLREAEGKLERLEQEVRALRETAQREAAGEAQHLREIMKQDAEKIALAGKAEVAASERAAQLELKAVGAQLAVQGAESLVAKQLTPQTQSSLITAFLKSLQGEAN